MAISSPAPEKRHARLLVVTAAPPLKRLPELFLGLLDAGTELVLSVPPDNLPASIGSHPGVTALALPLERSGPDRRPVALVRAAADLNRFLHPALARARLPRRRALRRFLRLAGASWSPAVAEAVEGLDLPGELCERLASLFHELEELIPPEPGLEQAVAGLDVDGILLVTRCVLGGFDPDVVKVARRLGIPSIMLVWSWDNLSGKAVLSEHPDHLLVWNDVQLREAVDQHGVPRERVSVLGAANFDRFFEATGAGARRPDTAGPARTILYLASTHKIAREEPVIFDRWLASVRACDDPAVREARVVVRPHPAVHAWDLWTPGDERVVVAPRDREVPRDPASTVELLRLLREADAVVALNTSAELEAAIAGTPVLTFRAPDAHGQEGSAHFEYLLEAHGGFVIDAATLEEHVARLAAVLRGEYDRGRLRAFVEEFIRPAGIGRAVTPAVASAIVSFARPVAASRPA